MSESQDNWKLTRSSEDPNDVRAWQRERNAAAAMYFLTLLVWLIAMFAAAVFSFDVIRADGFIERALVFVVLFLVELVFFIWLLRDIVFKRGR